MRIKNLIVRVPAADDMLVMYTDLPRFAGEQDILTQGITVALIIGFIGGLLPALRAARLPVAQALREL